MNQIQQKITRYSYRKLFFLSFNHVFWDLDVSAKKLQKNSLSPSTFFSGKK